MGIPFSNIFSVINEIAKANVILRKLSRLSALAQYSNGKIKVAQLFFFVYVKSEDTHDIVCIPIISDLYAHSLKLISIRLCMLKCFCVNVLPMRDEYRAEERESRSVSD